MSLELAALGIAVLLASNLLAATVLVVHRFARTVEARHVERETAHATPLVVDWLLSEPGSADRAGLTRELLGLRRRAADVAVIVLARAVSQLRGPRRTAGVELALHLGLVARVHGRMRARRAWHRALACEVAGLLAHESSVPHLVARLEDRSRVARTQAVRALGACRLPQAAEPLERILIDGTVPHGLVFDALIALGPAGVVVFRRALEDESPDVRRMACIGLGIADAEVGYVLDAPLLLARHALRDRSPDVRAAALDALANAADDDTADVALQLIDHPAAVVRRSAARALAHAAVEDEVRIALAARLDDPDRETAIRAAESLVATEQADDLLDDSWALQYARALRSAESL